MDENDPYKQMDNAEEGIQPDFLKKKSGEGAQKLLGAAEQAASQVMAAKGGGAAGKAMRDKKAAQGTAGLNGGEGSMKQGLENGLKAGEESNAGLYSGDRGSHVSNVKGGKGSSEPSLKMPAGLKMAAPFLIVLIAIIGIVALIVALPILMIGALDFNLMKVLGFAGTVGILEKQGEHVTAEMAMNGEFPANYAKDLAMNGLDVGQVTASGDFIKTNTYIANIEERDDLVAAASGFSYISDDEGELALLYNGDVIRADDFVARVESDPKLYAAYSNAANLSVKYYYGKDVNKVYKDMKLSRGNFNDWEATGDYDTDEASYNEIMTKILDGNESNLSVGGVHDDTPPIWSAIEAIGSWFGFSGPGTFRDDVPKEEDDNAADITNMVADDTKKYIETWYKDTCTKQVENADGTKSTVSYECQKPEYDKTVNQRAAELLNTAVSATEPYKASSTFLAIEEPIQRARIGDNGPVNHVMNTLSKPTSVTYMNVATGQNVTKNVSILETENFRAAVSDSQYSTEEAASFARDRVLQVTGQADKDIIKKTTVSSTGRAKSGSVVRNGDNASADRDIIGKAKDSMDMAVVKDNSELFQSVVGGNRAIEGGSFLSNNINQKVIGAMPSDAGTIAAYQVQLDEVLARKAEAERASLSPFDISSPYTFLGSIVHNLASTALGTSGLGLKTLSSALQATGGATGSALASLMGTAMAEGSEQEFTTLSPSNCETVGVIKVEGDLYCTAHNTVATDYMANTMEDWKKSAIGSSLEDDGKIKKDSELEKFVTMGMDRESSVGTKNAEVCKTYKAYNNTPIDDLVDFFSSVLGLYEACGGVDEGVALGRTYSFTDGSSGNLGLYSGYMLYNQVKSLLSEEKSSVALARERYYTEHPRDDSAAGELARISGMTKSEAEIALAYADYLTVIASYDASDRYAFGELDLGIEKPILMAHRDEVMENLYAWHREEMDYQDARKREVAAA